MMGNAKHRDFPRPWVVGVTCLFALSIYMATLIILRMYGVGEIVPSEIWGATAGAGALLFGSIFACFYLGSRRLNREAREQEMTDDR